MDADGLLGAFEAHGLESALQVGAHTAREDARGRRDRLRRQSAEMSLQQLMCQLEVSALALGSDGKQRGIHALVADPGAVSDDDQLYGCRRLVAKGAGCPGIDGLCQGGRAVVHGRSDVMFGRRAFVACRALPIRKQTGQADR